MSRGHKTGSLMSKSRCCSVPKRRELANVLGMVL